MSDLLFVYGTLRKGSPHPMAAYLASHAEYVTEGWFQGRMYRISYYPGVIASENVSDRIVGEIYKLSDPESVLKILDDFEECADHYCQPTEYKRTCGFITGLNGIVYVTVWIYLYQWSIKDKAYIKTGDFIQSQMS